MSAGFPDKEAQKYINGLLARIQELEDTIYPSMTDEYARGYRDGYYEGLGERFAIEPR